MQHQGTDVGRGWPRATALLSNVCWPPSTGPWLTCLWGSLPLCEAGQVQSGPQVTTQALRMADVMMTRTVSLRSSLATQDPGHGSGA